MPECRLQEDYGEIKSSAESKQEEYKEYGIINDELEFNFTFHILEMIMKFCVDVDYLNFRATCKHLAALPLIRWSNIETIPRLRTYPLVSPYSLVVDKDRVIITITDPMLGDKYFTRTPQEFVGDLHIHCSRYGWLLMSKDTTNVMFFNPFTSDIRKLPHLDFAYLESFCFSAPPTSRNCIVVGFTTEGEWHVYIHFVSREQSWRRLQMNFDGYHPDSFCFPTFFDRHIYALNNGELDVFIHTEEDYVWAIVVAEAPNSGKRSAKYYLTKSDKHLLLVSVDEFEKSIEVYKLNRSAFKWEKLDSLGKDMIYVCDTTCLCIEAKTSKMESKIYFQQSQSENDKIVFYSLKTHKFHTFHDDDMKGSFGDLFKPKRLLRPHAWIEPSCS